MQQDVPISVIVNVKLSVIIDHQDEEVLSNLSTDDIISALQDGSQIELEDWSISEVIRAD